MHDTTTIVHTVVLRWLDMTLPDMRCTIAHLLTWCRSTGLPSTRLTGTFRPIQSMTPAHCCSNAPAWTSSRPASVRTSSARRQTLQNTGLESQTTATIYVALVAAFDTLDRYTVFHRKGTPDMDATPTYNDSTRHDYPPYH